MDEKWELAVRKYGKGYNCCQAVFCAFADEMQLDEKTAMKVMEGFGAGMGGMQEVCGALSGAFAVLSYLYNDGNIGVRENRKLIYAKIKEVASEFKEKCGGVTCYDVLHGNKPVPHTCGMKVKEATMIVTRILDEKAKEELA